MDVLELACECKCENFVSNIIIQNILNNLWSCTNQTAGSIEPVKYFNQRIFISSFIFKTEKETEYLECQTRYNSDKDYLLVYLKIIIFFNKNKKSNKNTDRS